MNQPLIILILCGDTNRAKAYLTKLTEMKDVTFKGLIYGVRDLEVPQEKTILEEHTKAYFIENKLTIPNLDESIVTGFKKRNWEHEIITERNVNSIEVIEKINSFNADIVVFAGYGGQLLGKDHFIKGTKYLHCHPGWLPKERGSTTLYYSLLNDYELSVTAFYMTAEIDQGSMVLRKSFPIPSNLVNIDIWIDNGLRADCLFDSLQAIINSEPEFVAEVDEENMEYYVIHPLLKHISLLSLELKK